MSNYVVSLDQDQATDASLVGGKAAALSALAFAGFPVPPGLCLTSAAFSMALARQEAEVAAIIGTGDLRQPTEAERAADLIASLLVDLTVPAPVLAALDSTWAPAIDAARSVAVRSSSTAEDRADASYAGQYHTSLGVRPNVKDVAAAILACWRSFFSANALAARATYGALGSHESMAVLIQPMIAAECAGVCFTLDPVERRRDRLIVNAAWGLGAGVVDGTVSNDAYWVRRTDFKMERQVVPTKPLRVELNPEHGIRYGSVPEDQSEAVCLPPSWLARIAQYGVVAENLVAVPQEIEWAIADDKLWLLQSRPVTGLAPDLVASASFPITWENEEDACHLWTLDTPECLTPLELDHLARLEDVNLDICRFVAAERNRQIRVHNGFVYERRVSTGLTEGDRRIRRAAMEDLNTRLQQQGQTSWDYWGPEIVAGVERLAATMPESSHGPALATHLEDALALGRRLNFLHPLLWFKPRPDYIERFAALSGMSGQEAETAAHSLLGGSETSLTRLIDDLYELALAASREATVSSLIAASPADLIDQLRNMAEAASFLSHLEGFLTIYGERTGDGWGSEATLRTPIWREAPEQVLRLIAGYLDPAVEPPSRARQRSSRQRDQQVETFCNGCDDPKIVAEFRTQLAYARKTLIVLEEHNHYIEQLGKGHLRQALMAAAAWLVERGAVEELDDVFWLDYDEIFFILRQPSPEPLTEKITQRKRQYADWQEQIPLPILGMPDAHLPARDSFTPEARTLTHDADGPLRGIGASPGKYSGTARVMLDMNVVPNLAPGDILVAENVGPRWTPLFPILGGIVLDGGSIGQHAAATAREYGLPAVVGVGDATQRIADGSWITLDGRTGEVWLAV